MSIDTRQLSKVAREFTALRRAQHIGEDSAGHNRGIHSERSQ